MRASCLGGQDILLNRKCAEVWKAENYVIPLFFEKVREGGGQLSLVLGKRLFAYAKTKAQISFAVTTKLISAFVFATWIEQSLYFLNPKFQASSHLLWLYSPVCVRPGRKP